MSILDFVIKQTRTTFYGSADNFENNLIVLKKCVGKLDADSVGLDLRLLKCDTHELLKKNKKKATLKSSKPRRPVPLTFIDIFDSDEVSVGMIVIREGSKLPIHDHPFMHGINKVIYGKIKITSYTPKQKRDYSQQNGGVFEVTKLPPIIMEPTDEPVVFYPVENNIHEMEAIDGPAAFIDILSPPYNTDLNNIGLKCCNYFKEVSTSDGIKLTIIPAPPELLNDESPYAGPKLRVTLHTTYN